MKSCPAADLAGAVTGQCDIQVGQLPLDSLEPVAEEASTAFSEVLVDRGEPGDRHGLNLPFSAPCPDVLPCHGMASRNGVMDCC